jgi:DNA primase
VAKAPAEEIDVDGTPVRLTSPDKVYYPALGERGTKRAVVEHYRLVAPALLEALRERPTYLQRFPDGVEGEEVYQKRVPTHAPDYVETVRVQFPSGRSADALRPTAAPALLWAAQQATITFHPWHCTAPTWSTPTSCASTSTRSRAPGSSRPARSPSTCCGPTSTSSGTPVP